MKKGEIQQKVNFFLELIDYKEEIIILFYYEGIFVKIWQKKEKKKRLDFGNWVFNYSFNQTTLFLLHHFSQNTFNNFL